MLELKNLIFSAPAESEKARPAERRIIDGIDFTFSAGKFYAVTGPNGSGKTTLAKLIMGINPASAGKIIFNGEDITALSITDRARQGIAYSFQHPARFKGITFSELLAIALGTDKKKPLLETLARVGVCSNDFLDKSVDAKLSGGEIKKIELATTIARNPKLAIYDEPDTGIDMWTIRPMVDLLKKEQKKHRTTTIVISHNRAFLEAADEIIILKAGKIAYSGDFNQALPLLTDLSLCKYSPVCDEIADAKCYR